jgi:hypothetical protein
MASSSWSDNERELRILDMATSLIELFGDSASRIAELQRSDGDVGHSSGILWHEVSAAIDAMLALADRD